MQPQNIYDNPDFFEGYRKLRENADSANILEEKPAFFSLVPDLREKTVLDLGCGYGENCAQFLQLGAKTVLGIDISEKMLQIAKTENPSLQFSMHDMNDLSDINKTFDVIFSSLAIHYVENLDKFVSSVFQLLNNGGYFIFSQEHPLTTAPIKGASWVNEENGSIHYRLTDYTKNGERKTHWIVDNVIKYHRTFSSIVNAFTKQGFIIEKMLEPVPSQETIKRLHHYEKDLHKPNFLLIRVRKPE